MRAQDLPFRHLDIPATAGDVGEVAGEGEGRSFKILRRVKKAGARGQGKKEN